MKLDLRLLTLACWLAAHCVARTTFAAGSVPMAKLPETPQLAMATPRSGATFTAPARIDVEAIGLGRLGGITDVELLIDDHVVAESHLAFIRPPAPDEPVQHLLTATDVRAGKHVLVVREIGNRALASAPVSVEVLEGRDEYPTSIRIVSPLPSTLVPLGKPLEVQAVATGPFGGITHAELLLDGNVVAESRIFFIRAPDAGEPVQHEFRVDAALAVGAHRLQVRDASRPGYTSESVEVHVVAPVLPAEQPLLRLGSLADGTMLLVLSGTQAQGQVRIEASDDLLHWLDVGSDAVASAAPVARPARLAPAGATRFYRAILTEPGR